MNTFSFTRVSLLLKELWSYNKWLIISVPPVMIILFWLYYMLPDSIYHKLGNDYAKSENWRFLTIINNRTFLRAAILGVIPVYLYVCFGGYLRQLKTNSLSVLTPVSALERVFTIWIFSIGLTLVLLVFFLLTDELFAYIHRYLFWDETIRTLERNGDLYYDFTPDSVFSTLIQADFPVGLLVGSFLSTLPVLFLTDYAMPKAAILFYPLLGVAVFILLFPFAPYTVVGNYQLNISASPLFLLVYSAFIAGIHFLWMVAFYFRIKENEV